MLEVTPELEGVRLLTEDASTLARFLRGWGYGRRPGADMERLVDLADRARALADALEELAAPHRTEEDR
jgi:hypothetical protein